jgi:murein DD-endopeptidase MepM/ murein hydrolase activator NlpD
MILAAPGGMRHFWVEGLIATALTLSAVSAAYGTAVFSPGTDRPVAPTPTIAPVAAAPVAPAEPEPAFTFHEPVPGHSVNSPFGLRRMPWEQQGRLHEGVDIAAPSGARVVAVEDGVITRSGTSSSYGRFVEIRHGHGLVSRYAHLGRIDPAAKAGVTMKAGGPVGRIGSTGVSTGPHLHFELRRDDRPLNPAAFIGQEFETAEDLPLKAAGRYSRKVRVAQVSQIPDSKKKLMEARSEKGRKAKGDDGGEVKKAKDGRVMATLQVASCDAACGGREGTPVRIDTN